MTASLRAVRGGETFWLADVTLVGRGDDAGIRLTDNEVSRRHAMFRRAGSDYVLVDLGSSNGSYVNEQAVSEPRVLRPGDRVRFGGMVFHFEHSETVPPRKEPPLSERTQLLWREPETRDTQQVTLLVGDLRGFTAISERLGPALTASLLREWYAHCTAVMTRHGASIDKFIGDQVFAYWVGSGADVKVRAANAATTLRGSEIAADSPIRVQVLQDHGVVLDCCIGLHAGEAVIGALGRGMNTALGDAVNVAFHVEALTRRLGTPVLASAAFVSGLESFAGRFKPLGRHSVKGRLEMVEVFGLHGSEPVAS